MTASSTRSHLDQPTRDRVAGGVLLVTIGVIILAGRVDQSVERFVPLAIGLVALGAFAWTRGYGFAVVAGILSGLGTSILLVTGAAADAPTVGAAFMLPLAAGFLAVWLLGMLAVPLERHPWPLLPAAILGAIGAAVLAGEPEMLGWIPLGAAAVAIVIGLGCVVGRPPARS